MLEFVDMKKLSSAEYKAKIFQSLGRLLLEPVAEKFLLDFKIWGMIMILYIHIKTYVDAVRVRLAKYLYNISLYKSH